MGGKDHQPPIPLQARFLSDFVLLSSVYDKETTKQNVIVPK